MLGERLAEIRKDSGMTQQELADKIGVAASTISSYEIGNSSPDDDIKVAIARLFNISLDYLCGATDIEIPLIRLDGIDLPKYFPEDYRPMVQDIVSMITYRHVNDNKEK